MTHPTPTLSCRGPLAAVIALAATLAVPAATHAQDGASAPTSPSPAAPASAAAPSSPAKRELVQKILALQQPGLEIMARQLVQDPAGPLVQQAGAVLQQRVAADKREAAARDMQAELKKYMDETVPIVRDRAVKLAPTTVAPILEANFAEDELRQIASYLESPIMRKYQQFGGEMQRALVGKVVAETRGQVEPKVRALEQALSRRLTAAGAGAPASAPAKGGK